MQVVVLKNQKCVPVVGCALFIFVANSSSFSLRHSPV